MRPAILRRRQVGPGAVRTQVEEIVDVVLAGVHPGRRARPGRRGDRGEDGLELALHAGLPQRVEVREESLREERIEHLERGPVEPDDEHATGVPLGAASGEEEPQGNEEEEDGPQESYSGDSEAEDSEAAGSGDGGGSGHSSMAAVPSSFTQGLTSMGPPRNLEKSGQSEPQ